MGAWESLAHLKAEYRQIPERTRGTPCGTEGAKRRHSNARSGDDCDDYWGDRLCAGLREYYHDCAPHGVGRHRGRGDGGHRHDPAAERLTALRIEAQSGPARFVSPPSPSARALGPGVS